MGLLGLSLLVLTACGSAADTSAEARNIVQFANSGEAVPSATVTPLVISSVAGRETLTFGTDPNNDPTTTREDGTYTIDYRVPPLRAGVEVTIDVPSRDGSAIGTFGLRAEVDILAEGTEIVIPQPTPCEPADSCGNELLPDLTPITSTSQLDPAAAERLTVQTSAPRSADLFPDGSWFIDETATGRLLRFPTVAANIGTGPLDIIAEGVESNGATQTFQRIWTDTWQFRDVASGEFVFHPTHDHIHFDAFERYELVDAADTVVAVAEKVSFCLRDSIRISEERPEPTGVVFVAPADCGGNEQIINPGFGDHYHSLLDDQWIEISDVAPGSYRVRVIVDPLNQIVEADETNNTSTFVVTID